MACRVHNERRIVGVDKAGGREVAGGPEVLNVRQILVAHLERSHHDVGAVHGQELEGRGLLAPCGDLQLAVVGEAVVLLGTAHRDGGALGGVQHLGGEVKTLVAVDVGHGDAGLGTHMADRVRTGVAGGAGGMNDLGRQLDPERQGRVPVTGDVILGSGPAAGAVAEPTEPGEGPGRDRSALVGDVGGHAVAVDTDGEAGGAGSVRLGLLYPFLDDRHGQYADGAQTEHQLKQAEAANFMPFEAHLLGIAYPSKKIN